MQKAEKSIVITTVKTIRQRLEQPITTEVLAEVNLHLSELDKLATRTAPLPTVKIKIPADPNRGVYTGA